MRPRRGRQNRTLPGRFETATPARAAPHRALQHPFSNDGDLLGTPADPWVAAARALAPDGWGPRKQALAMRVFLQFFSDALDGYEAFVGRGRRGASPSIVIAAAAAAAATPPSQAPAAGSASGAAGAQSPRVRHAGASAGGAAALGLAAGGLGLGLGRVSFGSCSSRFTGTSGPSNLNVNLPALIAHHEARTRCAGGPATGVGWAAVWGGGSRYRHVLAAADRFRTQRR